VTSPIPVPENLTPLVGSDMKEKEEEKEGEATMNKKKKEEEEAEEAAILVLNLKKLYFCIHKKMAANFQAKRLSGERPAAKCPDPI
jgi:hypothetical protein